MKSIVQVRPVTDYRVWLRFADGVEGEVDLAHLVGKGVFRRWQDPEFFRQVHVGEFGELAWDEQIDLCPDALYLDVTHKHPEEIFGSSKPSSVHA